MGAERSQVVLHAQTRSPRCCIHDVTVTVKYNANSAEVTFDGKTEVLPQVESGSGIRYSNANWEWNSKGKGGFLTDRKSNTIVAADCRTR